MKTTTTTKTNAPLQAYQAAALEMLEKDALNLGKLIERLENAGHSYEALVEEEIRRAYPRAEELDANYSRIGMSELIATQNVCYALGVAVGRYLVGGGR